MKFFFIVFSCCSVLQGMEFIIPASPTPVRTEKRKSQKKHLATRKKLLGLAFWVNDIKTFDDVRGNIHIERLKIRSGKSRPRPLIHQSIIFKRTEFTKHLLTKCNISADQTDALGNTPLFHALDNMYLTQLLYNHNADPNHKNHLSYTPLHYAVASGKLKAIKNILLSDQVDLLAREKKGLTALGLAYKLKKSHKIINYLKDKTLERLTDDECCMFCLSEFQDVAREERSFTPCCTQFICETCLGTMKTHFFECGYCGRKL